MSRLHGGATCLRQAGGVPVRPVLHELEGHEDPDEDFGEIDEDEEPFLTGDDRRQGGNEDAECAISDLALPGRNQPRHDQSDDDSADQGEYLVHAALLGALLTDRRFTRETVIRTIPLRAPSVAGPGS